MEKIDKWIKIIKSARDQWAILFISLMAGIGFITGMLNLMMWFVEKTGEVPEFFFWIFKGFDIMIYAGITIIIIGWILFFTKMIKGRN